MTDLEGDLHDDGHDASAEPLNGGVEPVMLIELDPWADATANHGALRDHPHSGVVGDVAGLRGRNSMTVTGSILAEAESLVNGDRNAAYGDCVQEYIAVAELWSTMLGIRITARQAALCMCAVKLRREAHGHRH